MYIFIIPFPLPLCRHVVDPDARKAMALFGPHNYTWRVESASAMRECYVLGVYCEMDM